MACEIFKSPDQGNWSHTMPLAVDVLGACSLNHWTTREVQLTPEPMTGKAQC